MSISTVAAILGIAICLGGVVYLYFFKDKVEERASSASPDSEYEAVRKISKLVNDPSNFQIVRAIYDPKTEGYTFQQDKECLGGMSFRGFERDGLFSAASFNLSFAGNEFVVKYGPTTRVVNRGGSEIARLLVMWPVNSGALHTNFGNLRFRRHFFRRVSYLSKNDEIVSVSVATDMLSSKRLVLFRKDLEEFFKPIAIAVMLRRQG